MSRYSNRISTGVVVRILADTVMLNVALVMAFSLRLMTLVAIGRNSQQDLTDAFQRSVESYTLTSWSLTLLCLAIFYLCGFYTYGRAYQSRYKVLIIVQAVTLAYFIFGFLTYFIPALKPFPRSALLVGWGLSLIILIGARMWARIWRRIVKLEDKTIYEIEMDKSIRSVLLVGGAGYIGSVLCRDLLKKEYSVRVLDMLFFGQESVADLLDHPRFELIVGDSRDVGLVVRSMLNMDAVVHLGELVGDPACAIDNKLTIEINVAATRMMAEVARGYGIERFVYASSCSVYGAGSEILSEKSILRPVSNYARAKIASEQALLKLRQSDFHPVILRLATVYGLSHRPRFDLVINLLTAKAIDDREITIFGGEQWRPFVHVGDVAEAIVRCLEAPFVDVSGMIFNVGSNEQNLTIAQIGELIQNLIPETRIVYVEEDPDKRDYQVSFNRIRRVLAFQPRYTIEHGIIEIAVAVGDGRVGDYRDKRYNNFMTMSDPRFYSSVRSRQINRLYSVQSSPEFSGSSVHATVVGS